VADNRAWLFEQIKERLRFYGSMTSVGLDISQVTTAYESDESGPAASQSISVSGETLEEIQTDLGDCTRCRLQSGRRSIVFGVGNPEADLMFVGEGPGHDEDVQGIPFVGRAGQLLTKIVEAIQMSRDEVYIANIVKCRPPGNRDPEPDEIATCRPFVERQIESVRPKVICTLGRVAAQALLSTDKPLGRLRGQTFAYGEAVLVPTYHPAYLLRNPEKKRETWEDMKLVRRLLHERR
jgi:uracil-DNA glycosylase family 4